MCGKHRTVPLVSSKKYQVLLCLAFGGLYGMANYFSGKYYLPGCTFAEMRPQVTVPMLLGIYWGPLAGFVTGAFGDMLGYTIAGKGLFFAPFWSLANGLMGMIPGLLRYWTKGEITSTFPFLKLLTLLLAASSLPFTLSVGAEIFHGNISASIAVYKLFLPIVITDTLWAFMIVPAVLVYSGTIRIGIELRTVMVTHYLLIFTVLSTWIGNAIVTMKHEVVIQELYLVGGITLFVIVVGLGVSSFFARKITSPLITLTHVAEEVADGDYDNAGLLGEFATRKDEMGSLARIFENMIQAVEQREIALKQKVEELNIQIDHRKQQKDLKKITETNYFQSLKKKAGALREQAANFKEENK